MQSKNTYTQGSDESYPTLSGERLKAFLQDFKEMQEAGAVQDPPAETPEDPEA